MRALNKIVESFARKNQVEAAPIFPIPTGDDDESRKVVRN